MDLENNWWCFSLQQPFTSWKTITRPLFPKLNKPSFISLFSQVKFSKLFHCSCSSFNFFHPFKRLASKIRHSPWNPAAAQSDININTLQGRTYPGFSVFFQFFSHCYLFSLWFSTSPRSFSRISHFSNETLRDFKCISRSWYHWGLWNEVEMKVEKLYLVQHKGTYVIFFISVNSLLKRLGFSIKDLILFRNIYYNIISIL